MKNILVIYYSQSGQLTQIARSFAKPFEESDHYNVNYAQIKPKKEFGFPWKGLEFFDALPEAVMKIPCELEPLEYEKVDYDLIVFAYSVWYMSPAIPSMSFLLSEEAKNLFKGKKVLTLLGVRNMWVVAQEYVKQCLLELDAQLIGNVVLQDRSENLTGIVTISYFEFTGKKDRFLGIFPKPGVSDKDIIGASRFGEIVKSNWESNSLDVLQEELVKAKAVKVNTYLSGTERLAFKNVFIKWANFILAKGGAGDLNRKTRVKIFAFYFPFAILLIAPIKYVFFLIFAPFKLKKLKKERNYYSGINYKLNYLD